MANYNRKDTRMIYPPMSELTRDEFNRYELVVATAKCARMVTDEYITMRADAEEMVNNHETDKALSSLIDAEYRDQKAVRIAISRMHEGKYSMYRPEENAGEEDGETDFAEDMAIEA